MKVLPKRSAEILDKIQKHDDLSIDVDGNILYQKTNTTVSIDTFLHNLQAPTKKLSTKEVDLVKLLKLPANLVANSDAKKLVAPSGSKKQSGDGWKSFKR